jgi:hypothetical protein
MGIVSFEAPLSHVVAVVVAFGSSFALKDFGEEG